MQNIKSIIFCLTLHVALTFFIISAIVSYDYTGGENSNTYRLYTLILGCLSMAFVLYNYFVVKKLQLSHAQWLVLSIPVVASFLYFISGVSDPISKKIFISFYAFSMPGLLIGSYCSKKSCFESLIKWWDFLVILFDIGILILFVANFRHVSFSGLAYQSTAYLSAYAYSFHLYYLLFGSNNKRIYFFYSRFYKILSYFFLFLQIVVVLSSGGRGGTILLLVSSIILFYQKQKNSNVKSRLKSIFYLVITLLFIVFIFKFALNSQLADTFTRGINRAFSYIGSNDQLDFSKTSGRDIIYVEAWQLIIKKPLIGYGFWKYLDTFSYYPHNIILEILLQGGFIYLFVFILFSCYLFRKLRHIINNDKANLIIIPIGLYPCVMLMFSGSYLVTPLFWFMIGLILCYKK